MNKHKERKGIVYSTNPDFSYEDNQSTQADTLPPEKQLLKVLLDKKSRAGKMVTLIEGFIGQEEDMEALAKTLKTHCGAGGSAKEGVILIQGDVRDKVMAFLNSKGYKTKRVGG